ncbi:MAG: hypothetical protein HYX96_02815 [Chloroflexi bacterium]|nr:hypothetical protein [Chloroflexota bacterium]
MSRKMKVVISLVVALLLLSLGGTAAVMARENEKVDASAAPASDNASPGKAFLARVAAILGISEASLTAAMRQAGRELRQERFERLVDAAAEKDIITAAEAVQIKEWWAARPPAVDRLLGAARVQRIPVTPKLLEGAVKAGRVTPEEAEEIKQWWQDRPAEVDTLLAVKGKIEQIRERIERGVRNGLQKIGQLRENLDKYLDKAVERQLVTGVEADLVRTWWAQRPEAAGRILGLGIGLGVSSEAFQKIIEQALDRGRLTPEELQAARDWWAARPAEVLAKLAPKSILPALPARPALPKAALEQNPARFR